MKFKLNAPYKPMGDQPQAIEKLVDGVNKGLKDQVLLGVTGSGKTYTIANVIEQTQKPTLVISHNKTLAAQLYQEFRDFFPNNAVGFFISYYDYYMPESYIPQTDTHIDKEVEINEEIDKLRLQATSFLFSRRDVIIVASVSCIYNLGNPSEYGKSVLDLFVGKKIDLAQLEHRLIDLRYTKNRWELNRGQFRMRGDLMEIMPAYGEEIVQIWLKEDKIEKLGLRNVFSDTKSQIKDFYLYPAKHYLTDPQVVEPAFAQITKDLETQVSFLKKQGKLLEAQRLQQRVEYDLEMIKEVGYVNGIENYSRYFDNRAPGDPPFSLLDYFPYLFDKDYLVVIDESHMTIPQIRGMYHGDQSRKQTLIDFGFRLPSALDNRPLKFEEFMPRVQQAIYVSATPDEWEINKCNGKIVEQLIRPTGLTEPIVTVRPTPNQVADVIDEVVKRKEKNERVLVTTLTKRLAEDLSEFMKDPKNTNGIDLKVSYLHADVETLDRSKILADLRKGDYDVIVGINLLREGLDLPEVSLVAILDADAYGFLRSATSLTQTMGRAARNSAGEVILYADTITPAIKYAMSETERRRLVQVKYNEEHGITPTTIVKPIRGEVIEGYQKIKDSRLKIKDNEFKNPEEMTPSDIKKEIKRLKTLMKQLAASLEFEQAAKVRDEVMKLNEWLRSG